MESYGADIARFYMMFTAPPEQTLEWSDDSVEGASRFLRRVWSLGYETAQRPAADMPAALPAPLAAARREIHAVLKQGNYDLGRHQFNTVASATMKMLNALEGVLKGGNDAAANAVLREGLSILLRVLSPITPHITHQLWRDLGYGEDILNAAWPEPDAQALVESEMELVVQVNGKLRDRVRLAPDADEQTALLAALASDRIKEHTDGKTLRKVVYVQGRLLNLVVS